MKVVKLKEKINKVKDVDLDVTVLVGNVRFKVAYVNVCTYQLRDKAFTGQTFEIVCKKGT
ncbi:hypothetical protein LCGC14_2115470 [marine sediment metagenome]|uniref:Uncharacterized protein n=1 Tax=marine sediment metagenome TaxID=412755 RepID=A0A0F9E5X1_9ZZZZ